MNKYTNKFSTSQFAIALNCFGINPKKVTSDMARNLIYSNKSMFPSFEQPGYKGDVDNRIYISQEDAYNYLLKINPLAFEKRKIDNVQEFVSAVEDYAIKNGFDIYWLYSFDIVSKIRLNKRPLWSFFLPFLYF